MKSILGGRKAPAMPSAWPHVCLTTMELNRAWQYPCIVPYCLRQVSTASSPVPAQARLVQNCEHEVKSFYSLARELQCNSLRHFAPFNIRLSNKMLPLHLFRLAGVINIPPREAYLNEANLGYISPHHNVQSSRPTGCKGEPASVG